jgi:signal peptidase I
MHISLLLIGLLVIFGLAIVVLCLWLSLKMFGVKTDRPNLYKIVGYEAAFLAATSVIGSVTDGGLTVLFDLLFLVGGIVLWVGLLKRFAPHRYSLGRAIGSYITSYVCASVVALAVAIMGIAFFAQVYTINGDSMAPALKADQTVLIYKFEKHPKKGDVIVYKNAETGGQALGRIEGLSGETVTRTAGTGIIGASLYTLGSTEYYVTTDNTSYNIPPRIINADSIVGTIGPKL